MNKEEPKVERATDENFLDFFRQMQEQRKGEKAVFMCVRCKRIKRLNVNYDELSLGFLPKGWFWFFEAVFCDECYKPFTDFMKETCGNE